MVKSYQGFRGFLALGVFMVHLSILRHTFLANVYDNWLIGCGAFCVLFFFLLSGFGIGSSFAYKGNSAYTCKGLKSYYWRRIKAIYPASIIITLALIFWTEPLSFLIFLKASNTQSAIFFSLKIFSMFPESTQSVGI